MNNDELLTEIKCLKQIIINLKNRVERLENKKSPHYGEEECTDYDDIDYGDYRW